MTDCCPLCGNAFKSDDLILVPSNHLVLRNGLQVHLAPKEWEIFAKIYRANGRVISKSALLDLLYQLENDEPFSNVISAFVCRIRQKVKPLGVSITSYKRHGYCIEFDGRSRVVKG